MLWNRMSAWLKRATMVIPLIWVGGCVEYTIETTLEADGGGVRDERMVVGENENVDVSPSDFGDLMFVKDGYGWTHSTELDDDGDTLNVFQRHTEVKDLASWSDLSDGVRIAGATKADAGLRIGYVSLADVGFRNGVRVESGRESDGSVSYVYRETFYWENAADVIVEFLMGDFDRTLKAKYPELSDQHRGEIVGFARARLWVAVDDGIFGASDEEEKGLLETAIARTTEQAIKIVRLRYSGADEEFMANVLNQLYEGEDGRLETFLDERVPGLNLAFNTQIVFRLNMPGRITNSNAHKRDGNTLVWEFGPVDAIASPIEILAESVVGR